MGNGIGAKQQLKSGEVNKKMKEWTGIRWKRRNGQAEYETGINANQT